MRAIWSTKTAVRLSILTSSVAALIFALFASACGSSADGNTFTDAAASGDGQGGGDAAFAGDVVNFGGDGGHGDGGAMADAFMLPENFVPTEKGGYALGPPLASAADGGLVQNGPAGNCALVVGVVRDFHSYAIEPSGHPDFERFSGTSTTPKLVMSTIGADRKPVYGAKCDDNSAPNPPCPFGQEMTNSTNFDQWYRTTQGVNDPYLVYLELVPNGGVYTFESNAFFPLDHAGFGNTPGFSHNFSFTTEIHLKFTYKGGETFSFSGDDDLWVFIDGKLAIDLGGLHTPVSASVALDTLGLTKGSDYDLELFNAERHSVGSNFRVDSNLSFSNCGTVPPEPK